MNQSSVVVEPVEEALLASALDRWPRAYAIAERSPQRKRLVLGAMADTFDARLPPGYAEDETIATALGLLMEQLPLPHAGAVLTRLMYIRLAWNAIAALPERLAFETVFDFEPSAFPESEAAMSERRRALIVSGGARAALTYPGEFDLEALARVGEAALAGASGTVGLVDDEYPGFAGEVPELHRALVAGNRWGARRLLDAGARADFRDSSGSTALHLLAWLPEISPADADLVKPLSAAGVAIDAVDRYGNTALHIAARRGLFSLVLALLDAGAAVRGLDGEGSGLLHHVVSDDDASVALRCDALRRAIAAGADPNERDALGKTAAMLACERIRAEELRVLLATPGFDPNIMAGNGATALHIAVGTGSLELVSLLLSAGAEPNARDATGITPLRIAEDIEASTEMLELMTRAGAKRLRARDFE